MEDGGWFSWQAAAQLRRTTGERFIFTDFKHIQHHIHTYKNIYKVSRKFNLGFDSNLCSTVVQITKSDSNVCLTPCTWLSSGAVHQVK